MSSPGLLTPGFVDRRLHTHRCSSLSSDINTDKLASSSLSFFPYLILQPPEVERHLVVTSSFCRNVSFSPSSQQSRRLLYSISPPKNIVFVLVTF